MPRARILIVAATAVVVAAYAAFAIAFQVKQEAWIHASPRERAPGIPAGLPGLELRIAAGERGETFAAWWLPAGEGAPAVLYLLGVGHTLADETATIALLRGFGASVLAIEYRGFGLSDAPVASERTVYEDSRAAWSELVRLAPHAPRRTIHGHSLGGAAAIRLASERPDASAIILESTFTSMASVLEQSRIMRMLPLSLVLTQRYPSEDRIGGLAMPKLFVHGADDIFVPPRMSETLLRRARDPKALVLVPGAGHTGALAGSEEARVAARRLITGQQ